MSNVVELPTAMSPDWREVCNTFRQSVIENGGDPNAAEFVVRRLMAILATVPEVHLQCLPLFAAAMEQTADAYKERESTLIQAMIGLLVELWNSFSLRRTNAET